MSVFWKRWKNSPMLTRGLVELARTNVGETWNDAAIQKSITEIQGWKVFLPGIPETPVFAARFVSGQNVLLTVAFPSRSNFPLHDQVRSILTSFQPNDAAQRRWSAFGLDVTLPEKMKLSDVQALPALQMMRFENDPGESITIHRYGMFPLILGDDDVATFFARRKGKRFLLRRESTFIKDGKYEGECLSYQPPGKLGISRLTGRARMGRVWLWSCDDLRRLYSVDCCARKNNLPENLADSVQCG